MSPDAVTFFLLLALGAMLAALALVVEGLRAVPLVLLLCVALALTGLVLLHANGRTPR